MNDFKHYRGRGRGSFQHNFRGTLYNNIRRANQNPFPPLLPMPHFRDNKHRWQRPQHPNIWRPAPPRMVSFMRQQLPPPFIQQKSLPVKTRPVSPLPGSEEARQKVIAEASARIKEQLNLDENNDTCVATSQSSVALCNNSFNKFEEDCSIVSQTFSDNSQAQNNKPPERNLKKRIKKPNVPETSRSVEELRNKILTQFTYMSKGKIQNLVNNPGSSKYDGYLQHLVRDMRLNLSSELRNMYNNRESDNAENNDMIDRFNSIVPDLGVELVSLPDTMVAELSKILQFDVNNEIQIPNSPLNDEVTHTNVDNTLVEPEDMFKQAETLLLNTEFLGSSFDNCTPELENINQQVKDVRSLSNRANSTFSPDSTANFIHTKRFEHLNSDPFMYRSPVYNEPPPNISFNPSNSNITQEEASIPPTNVITGNIVAQNLIEMKQNTNQANDLDEIPLPDSNRNQPENDFSRITETAVASRDSSPFSKKLLEVNLLPDSTNIETDFRSSNLSAMNPVYQSYSNSPIIPRNINENSSSSTPENSSQKVFNFNSVWITKPNIQKPKPESKPYITSFLNDVISNINYSQNAIESKSSESPKTICESPSKIEQFGDQSMSESIANKSPENVTADESPPRSRISLDDRIKMMMKMQETTTRKPQDDCNEYDKKQQKEKQNKDKKRWKMKQKQIIGQHEKIKIKVHLQKPNKNQAKCQNRVNDQSTSKHCTNIESLIPNIVIKQEKEDEISTSANINVASKILIDEIRSNSTSSLTAEDPIPKTQEVQNEKVAENNPITLTEAIKSLIPTKAALKNFPPIITESPALEKHLNIVSVIEKDKCDKEIVIQAEKNSSEHKDMKNEISEKNNSNETNLQPKNNIEKVTEKDKNVFDEKKEEIKSDKIDNSNQIQDKKVENESNNDYKNEPKDLTCEKTVNGTQKLKENNKITNNEQNSSLQEEKEDFANDKEQKNEIVNVVQEVEKVEEQNVSNEENPENNLSENVDSVQKKVADVIPNKTKSCIILNTTVLKNESQINSENLNMPIASTSSENTQTTETCTVNQEIPETEKLDPKSNSENSNTLLDKNLDTSKLSSIKEHNKSIILENNQNSSASSVNKDKEILDETTKKLSKKIDKKDGTNNHERTKSNERAKSNERKDKHKNTENKDKNQKSKTKDKNKNTPDRNVNIVSKEKQRNVDEYKCKDADNKISFASKTKQKIQVTSKIESKFKADNKLKDNSDRKESSKLFNKSNKLKKPDERKAAAEEATNKQFVLNKTPQVIITSKGNQEESVLSRLLEIDLQIQKLMQEKWILYQQLDVKDLSNHLLNLSTIPPLPKPFVMQYTDETSVAKNPELQTDNSKLRPVSSTPSESSILSDSYPKTQNYSRGSESSFVDAEEKEESEEEVIVNRTQRKRTKKPYLNKQSNCKVMKKIIDDDDSDIEVPKKFKRTGKNEKTSINSKSRKRLDSDSEMESHIKKKRKIDEKPAKKDKKLMNPESKNVKLGNEEKNSDSELESSCKKMPEYNGKSELKNDKKSKNIESKNIKSENEQKCNSESVEQTQNINTEKQTVKNVEELEEISKHDEKSSSKCSKITEEQKINNKNDKKLQRRQKKSFDFKTPIVEDKSEEENKKFFVKIKKPAKKKTEVAEKKAEVAENKITDLNVEIEKDTESKPTINLETEETTKKPSKIVKKTDNVLEIEHVLEAKSKKKKKCKDELPKSIIEDENIDIAKSEKQIKENKEQELKIVLDKSVLEQPNSENMNNNNIESNKDKKVMEYKVQDLNVSEPEHSNKTIKLKIVKSDVHVEPIVTLRRSRRGTTDEKVTDSSVDNSLVSLSTVKRRKGKKSDDDLNRRSRSRSASKESDLKNMKTRKLDDFSENDDDKPLIISSGAKDQKSESEMSEASFIDEKIRTDQKINAKRKRKLSKDSDTTVIDSVNKFVPNNLAVKQCFVKLERVNINHSEIVSNSCVTTDPSDHFQETTVSALSDKEDAEIHETVTNLNDKVDDITLENKTNSCLSLVETEINVSKCLTDEGEDFKGYDHSEMESDNKPAIEIDYQTDQGMFCIGHDKSILDIKVIGEEFLAASEDGTIYKYCLKTGELQDAFTGHKRAVTCICLMSGKILDTESTIMYSGSLDCSLKCYNIDTAEILHSVTVSQAIQCMDTAWGYIFLGTYDGLLFIYNIKKKLLNEQSLTIANATVLMIKATQEGSRQVLILASRKREIMVRDAFTGLLLRTMCQDQKPTIYSLLLDHSKVYCGTSDKGILILDFNNGTQTGIYNSGKGVVCMIMYKYILFAGCYDGMIYVYNTKTEKEITRLSGPGEGMLLSLAISNDMIIAGTKKDHLLKIWKVPQEILNQIN